MAHVVVHHGGKGWREGQANRGKGSMIKTAFVCVCVCVFACVSVSEGVRVCVGVWRGVVEGLNNI